MKENLDELKIEEERDQLELQDVALDDFEVIEKPLSIIKPISKQGAISLFGGIAGAVNLFGDEAEAVRSENAKFARFISELKIDIPFGQNLSDEDAKAIEEKAVAFYRFLESKAKSLNLPENSYRKKALDAVIRSCRYKLDGTYQYLMDKGITEPLTTYSVNTFTDFPTPMFKVGEKEVPGSEKKEIVYEFDEQKYEKVMAEGGFLEQYLITEDYVINHQLPYYKDKDAGKVEEITQKAFKKATHNYLKKQKANLEKIRDLKFEGDVANMSPFARDKYQFMSNWAGERHFTPLANDIDAKMKLLDNGWNPEDLPFIDSAFRVMKTIERSNAVSEDVVARHKEAFNEFLTDHIDEHIDRRRLINLLRPMYKTYEKLTLNEKNVPDKTETKILESTIRNKKVDIIHLDSDERDRTMLIKNLSEGLTGLNAQHRGSLRKHEDSEEMDLLKQKVIELSRQLHMDREGSIYDSEKFQKLCEEVSSLANKYIEEKRKEFVQKTKAEAAELKDKKFAELDEELKNRKFDLEVEYVNNPKKLSKALSDLTTEINGKKNGYERRLKEETSDKIKAWRPSTKMGKTRYESTLSIIEMTDKIASSIKYKREVRKEMAPTEEEMRTEGYTVTNMDEIEFMSSRPYEIGLKCITNYYGKNPMFITDHCNRKNSRKMYSKEQFKEMLKPVDVDGVTSDEFAAISYATVLDPDTIKKEDVYKMWKSTSPNVTKGDILSHGRTMFTLDMAKGNGDPRSGMAGKFLGWTLVPAKEKAKEAIEAYNNGDRTKLADILAVGMREVNNDCVRVTYLTRESGLNFAYSSSMLEKMVKFAEKDPILNNMVQQKLGKENYLAVQDTLRLKGYMDECYDAERKLQKAADERIPLSKQEKQECINAIVRFEFLSTVHDKERLEQVQDDPEIIEYRKEENYRYRIMHANELNLSAEDITFEDNKLVNKASKPVVFVNKNLRTKEGIKRLDESVKRAAKGLDAGQTEKELIKNIKKCTDGLHLTAKKMRDKTLARREAFDKKRAELEKNAQQKKGNIKNEEAQKPKVLG